jgi:hypothetical protein
MPASRHMAALLCNPCALLIRRRSRELPIVADMIIVTTPTGAIGHQILENVLRGEEPIRVIARDPSRLPSHASSAPDNPRLTIKQNIWNAVDSMRAGDGRILRRTTTSSRSRRSCVCSSPVPTDSSAPQSFAS